MSKKLKYLGLVTSVIFLIFITVVFIQSESNEKCGVGINPVKLPLGMKIHWYTGFSGRKLQILDSSGFPIVQAGSKIIDDRSGTRYLVDEIIGYYLEAKSLFIVIRTGVDTKIYKFVDDGKHTLAVLTQKPFVKTTFFVSLKETDCFKQK